MIPTWFLILVAIGSVLKAVFIYHRWIKGKTK